MKKINTIRQTFLQLGVALALALILVFLSAAAADHAPAAAVGFNATRIADFLPDDEEFMMESETNRRILAGNGGNQSIVNPALIPDQPACDGQVYGSCSGEPSRVYDPEKRSCRYEELCRMDDQ